MTSKTNETHDASVRSWVESANLPDADFPIQNLPFGVFRTAGTKPRIGVAIGDQILDLSEWIDSEGHGLSQEIKQACRSESLNALMSLGPAASALVRRLIFQTMRDGQDSAGKDAVSRCLVRMSEAEMLLPASIGDYTDFYASVFHATNVGSMFRPDNPLLPNYKYVPIAYHGRASSIVASRAAVRRPCGQIRDDASQPPVYGPTRRLDYELEVGCFIGRGNELGRNIGIDEASEHIFGLCLVNDWSARDIQTWEYQPLGPFLAKNFATTISPWVVTSDALAPFRTAAFRRAEGDPKPLPHLFSEQDQSEGGFDIVLEVYLSSARMREGGIAPLRVSRGNFRDMYWTPAQMVTHHASNGCNLRAGDLLASGTVSGATKESRGCLLELTWRGTEPLQLPSGETRSFLLDGDEVTIRAYCEREGYRRIGFGECGGTVLG